MRRSFLVALFITACDSAEPPPGDAVTQAIGSMVAEREATQDARLQAVEREQRLLRDKITQISHRRSSPNDRQDDWSEFREKRVIDEHLETLERAEALGH